MPVTGIGEAAAVDPVASLVSALSAQVLTRTAVKTSSYTAAAGDLIPVDTTSGSVTVTLPAAPANRSRICVKQVTRGGSNTVTVARGGSDVFNVTGGSTSLTLTLALQAVLLEYNSTGGIWTVIADDLALTNLDAYLSSSASTAYGTFASVADLHGTNGRVAVYHVDPTRGSDSYDGLTWKKPKATIAAAITAANTAVQPATIVLSNDRHDVGAGLSITKGQPVTITGTQRRPMKYASPSSYSAIPAGCGPILYSSTGANPLVSYTGNGVAQGGSFQSVCFECTGASQQNAIVALGVNHVQVDDCLFFFTTATPAAATAIWAYNLALPAGSGDDSSWWRITNNLVAKAGLVKFGSSSSDTVAVDADANQNVIRDNFGTGRRINPGDDVAPFIEINRGHRTAIRDNNVELYTTGILLRGCFQCSESGNGGERTGKFLRLVNTRSTDLAPIGTSNAGNISDAVLVSLESTSTSNTIRTPATTATDALYGTTAGAISVDSTSPLHSQTVITTDATSAPAYRVIPKTAVRSGSWAYAPEGGAFTTFSLVQATLRYSPLGIDRACTVTDIGIEVTSVASSGGVIRLGIWADDGSGYPTGSPLLDAGTVAATSTTGFKSITGLSLPLSRGLYWVGAVTQGSPSPNNPQVRGVGGIVPGVVPGAGPVGGSNVSGYQDAGTVSGSLGVPSITGNATGPLIAVKFS